jgi:hypothetical protein
MNGVAYLCGYSEADGADMCFALIRCQAFVEANSEKIEVYTDDLRNLLADQRNRKKKLMIYQGNTTLTASKNM